MTTTNRHKLTGALLALKRRRRYVSTFYLLDAEGNAIFERYPMGVMKRTVICKNENVAPLQLRGQLTMEL